MDQVIARFAPSPTGQVHIGNIRTAIFNWLFARHTGGQFLLRIEDTDLERSTKEAIDTLLECMEWLGLDYDGVPMYQTKQLSVHLKAAQDIMAAGHAYRLDPADEKSPVYFRIPWNCGAYDFIRETGAAEIEIAPETVVQINRAGLTYQTLSSKGKPVENQYCIAGFYGLQIKNNAGEVIFAITDDNIQQILDAVTPIEVNGAAKLCFTRREVYYHDLVKGDMAKPLDSMRDFIVIRSDGSPVFHLANVCDDITQGVTHIVRGDDHVENTFRHLFLFELLGAKAPVYAHLPMLVNAQGKPYSKRDGDAFVGDYREKGYLSDALFNYLSLLGWSPGDNREKMTRQEIIEAFQIEKAQRSPAQLDTAKLANMNGLYLAEMEKDTFVTLVKNFADKAGLYTGVDGNLFRKAAELMQSRTKVLTDISTWGYFFSGDFEFDAKAVKKNLSQEGIWTALKELAAALADLSDFTAPAIENTLRATEEKLAMKQFALNQPLRVALTGIAVGADMYATVEILGKEETAKRMARAIAELGENKA